MSMKKVRKAKSPRWVTLFRLMILFAPYIAVLAVKRDHFFSLVNGTIVFSAAGMVCAVVLLFLIFSVSRHSETAFAIGAAFALSALFSFFLEGAALATGVAFLCKLMDKSVMIPLYEYVKEKALVEKAAQRAMEQMQEGTKSFVGRV